MFKPVFSVLIVFIGMVVAPLALAATSSTSTTLAETSSSTASVNISRRLKRIEQILDNQVMLDMLQRIESLQTEVRELRGELESQAFELKSMRKRQRDLYLDTDRRLRTLELVNGSKGQVANQAIEESSNITGTGNATGAASTDTAAPVATAGSGTAVVSGNPAKEKAAYSNAFNYLKEGRYEGAIKAFSQFLQDYPGGDYADNAQYWLGEANYVLRFYTAAIDAFETVISWYPTSPKVADARLKIGYVYYELKDWQAARDVLTDLQNDFPGTSVARLASKRLTRMSDEGH